MKRILVAAILTVAMTAMAAPPCWACSCAGGSKKEAAKSADVIFTGKVLEITGGDTTNGSLGDDELKVRFRVKKVYKGHPRESTRVFTNESGATCGYSFKVGLGYTVFAHKNADGKKYVSSCSGTKKGGINPDNYGLPDAYAPKDS